jgi:hypothetical protein
MSERSNEATPIPSSHRWTWAVHLALLLLVAVAYWPLHSFGFVSYDDPGNVTENPHVTSGLTAENIRWAFSSYWVGHWAPLTWISFQLEASCWHLNPGAMHTDNVLLHGLSVVILFGLLRLTTKRFWTSAWVAAVFAVHPLHVESVAWITERRDVLSAPLLLAALCAYSGYARHEAGREAGRDRHARGWYALSLGLYALSLTAKSVGITLPVLLLLFDLWPLQRRARLRQILLEKIPFLLLALGAAWTAQQAQRVAGASFSLAQLPISARLSNAIVTYALYLLKFVWPHRLAVFYPLRTWSVGQVLLAFAVLVLISIGVALSRRRYAIMGWGWFILCMSPMIGLFQAWSQGMADRYMYLPMIGLLILLAWAATEMRWKRIIASLGWTAVIVLMGLARYQVGFWHDSHRLLGHALELMNNGTELHIQLA